MTNANTKASTKETINFKLWKSLIALLLAVITAFSVVTVTATQASAAEVKSSSKVSINTNSTLSGLTTSVVSKAIEIATKGNPVAAVLGSGVSSVFGSIFSAFLPSGPSNQEILDAVEQLSDQIAANHEEEMRELTVIQNMVEDTKDTLDLEGFNNSYRDMSNIYNTIFEYFRYKLPENAQELSADNKIIDDDTYTAYKDLLTKVGFSTSIDIDARFNNMYRYLSEDYDNTFLTIAQKYINATQRKGAVDFYEAGDLKQLKENIQKIESDVIMYYTAYINLLQMEYQCKNYEYNNGHYNKYFYKDYPTAAYEKQFDDLGTKLSKIDEAFVNTCDYIESSVTAVVEIGREPGLWRTTDSKYFAFTPLAWSVAATTASNRQYEYSIIKFYLYEDWVAPSADAGLAIDKQYLNYAGFDKQNGTLSFTTDRGIWIDTSVDGGHIIDGSKMKSNVGKLLNVTLNGDLTGLAFIKSDRCFKNPSKQFAMGDSGWLGVYGNYKGLNWLNYGDSEEYITF